ncbi:MAG: transglutaminase domain-containing protein [Ruminococcus sp.]|nr:transglutaminase domain-containing protein [Ruminococcus sp.]
MKKLQRACAFICAAALIMSGCSKSSVSENSKADSKQENKTGSIVSQNVRSYGSTVSVADIKAAYEVDDSKEIMPLYNVAQTEAFTFDFNFDGYEVGLDLYDYVSVHTDSACEQESEIYYTAGIEPHDGVTTITVAPMSPVLKTKSQSEAYVYEDTDMWGNAPMYYIAIHYDMDADTPVKLDEPIVIPFTVKNEVQAPNAKGVVDATGRFKLVWEPVEGAEKYRIYNLTDGNLYTGRDNHALNGSKIGYENLTMLYEGETTECYYDNFAGEGHGLAQIENNTNTYTIGQNYCVNGEFFVSAVVNDVESGVSAAIPTADLQLPYVLTEDSDILFSRYATASDFPSEVDVLNIDGTVSKHKVSYTKVEGINLFGMDRIQYDYSVEGTAITGYVVPDDENGYVPAEIDNSSDTGTAEPENNVNKIPDEDVDTIIPVNPDETPENDGDTSGVIDQQKDNTQEHIEQGNKAEVENVPEGVYINAETAEEEWLALNLVQGNSDISVEAFPSLQDPYTLVDVFNKVYYQNPFVLGVSAYAYDYQTMTFTVTYVYDKETISAKQAEIAAKANEIIAQNISDDMTASDKALALYNYLVDNCVYDKDALAAAEGSDYTKAGMSEFEDSFNTYGILVNGKGVCMSYAYSYRLLCDMSGVECMVITGYLDGNLPHAWNMIKLDDEWYEIDCTNNAVTTGIPYFLYKADSKLAEQSGYTKDNLFEIDDAVDRYSGEDATKEYYESNGLATDSMEVYKQLIIDNVTADTGIFAIRWNSAEFDEQTFTDTVALAFNELGIEDRLENASFTVTHGFIVLIIK